VKPADVIKFLFAAATFIGGGVGVGGDSTFTKDKENYSMER
jgi:hypothetical protein